jgi:hypothetical protein
LIVDLKKKITLMVQKAWKPQNQNVFGMTNDYFHADYSMCKTEYKVIS